MINQRKAGVILSYAGQFVKILISFVYTPIMLRLLGQNEYGLYQLVCSVVSYLGLLSLGFGSSYMRFYSRFKAAKDDLEVARLNGMFLLIFLVLSFICILCGSIMVKNITLIFGTGLTKTEYSTAKVLMVLLIFNLAVTFPNSVFSCTITAHERFLFQKCLILLQNICNPLLALPLLIMGYGSVGMVLVTTVLTLLVFVLNIYYSRYRLQVKFLFKNLNFSLLHEMWVFTFYIFINQIIDQINWSVDKFLLGRLAGTSAVAIYGVGGQINSMYIEFSSSISNVFVPKVNRIVAESNNNEELTVLLTKVGRFQFMILFLILSGFLFFGSPFINLWAGNQYHTSYFVTLLLIIPVTVPLIQNLGIEIQRAKNMHRARAIVYLFIAIGNILISIPLIKLVGPLGAALGTSISLIIGNVIFMNWYYHKKIGLNMFYFWRKMIELIPSLIIPIIIGLLMMKFVNITGFITLIIIAIMYTIIYVISLFIFGMNYEEKHLLINPLKKYFSN